MTGLDAQQTRMSNIANNLANSATNGFKSGRVVFEDLLYQTVKQVGGLSSQQTELPSGLMLGSGTRVVSTQKMFQQGSILPTGNELDVAIEGQGFFRVLMPDGNLAYTRDGAFQRDSLGNLVTSSGYQLDPPVNIPPDAISVTIGRDGTVSVQRQGQAAATQQGAIQLFNFINPAGMQPTGENLFLASAASGPETAGVPGQAGLGLLRSQSIEGSNVNVVEELVSMIETQRAYEINSRVISANDQMLQYLSNNL
jgi:flagellar basal-body rod protein FlgG